MVERTERIKRINRLMGTLNWKWTATPHVFNWGCLLVGMSALWMHTHDPWVLFWAFIASLHLTFTRNDERTPGRRHTTVWFTVKEKESLHPFECQVEQYGDNAWHDVAEQCAEYYYWNCDGSDEKEWPLTIFLRTEKDGPIVVKLGVNLEYDPTFTAYTRLEDLKGVANGTDAGLSGQDRTGRKGNS